MTDDSVTRDYLTVAELATELRVSVATARRWCGNGTVPALKIGRGYRIERAALERSLGTYRTSTPVVLR